MTLSLPVGIDGKLCGTAFLLKRVGDDTLFCSTAHQIGNGQGEVALGIVPHGGVIGSIQRYPVSGVKAVKATTVYLNPLLDLAILKVAGLNGGLPDANLYNGLTPLSIGHPAYIIGYPFCVVGSLLQTADKTNISAIGRRAVINAVERNEFVLQHFTHIGSSGSPVISEVTREVVGMVLGCLAPPNLLEAGGLPIGNESSVTFCLSAEHIQQTIKEI